MKKTIIHFFALGLILSVPCGCKNDKQAAAVAAVPETENAVTTDKTPLPDDEAQEVPDEKMEKQGGMYDPSDVARFWKKRTIQVPGSKNDIVALFEAFYTEWPTVEGNRIVHMTNPALAPEHERYEWGSVIDRKNGYVESAWYECEDEDLGTVSACVWNRKNGHKLFAVNFASEKHFVCFYDYDPAKRTLTPEESPIKKEHFNFPDKEPLWYTLPQEGKTLEVVERVDDDYKVWSTYYQFDGQNLKFAGHEQ
ncbi:MAG: hypothetical protein IJ808_06950 [Muribaculaceae bacterium]|nr:hypothetical protein [Muribaculaceae bacterium]MBR1882736.1 hypothetical protein [Muribaculaceae bacterium]